ncbi:hypothetical protein GGR54DRAFT_367143 [Hypoxylon sp. NC1633]|nr:hypothetical protein GGR54DRAFT_367143 [Hypoxylon sp. NC1633]
MPPIPTPQPRLLRARLRIPTTIRALLLPTRLPLHSRRPRPRRPSRARLPLQRQRAGHTRRIQQEHRGARRRRRAGLERVLRRCRRRVRARRRHHVRRRRPDLPQPLGPPGQGRVALVNTYVPYLPTYLLAKLQASSFTSVAAVPRTLPNPPSPFIFLFARVWVLSVLHCIYQIWRCCSAVGMAWLGLAWLILGTFRG